MSTFGPLGAVLSAILLHLWTHFKLPSTLPLVVGLVVIWTLYLVLKKLYLHPLSKFPGPRIAAITRWYEFYHDVICDGTYVKHYRVLHEKHNSPVVRISTNHLHINDPDYYREVFNTPTEYRKAPYFYENLGITESLVGITDPNKHRIHRNIVNPLFSSRATDAISPQVAMKVQRAAESMLCQANGGHAVDIQQMYRRITVDVISETLFGQSPNLVESNDPHPEFLVSVDMFTSRMWLTKHFSFLNKIALNLPTVLAEIIAPGYVHFRQQCSTWVTEVSKRRELGVYTGEDGRPTVFDLLLEPNPEKGYLVPGLEELVDEAFLFLVAGSDTTAYSLACATYYLLTDTDVLQRLQCELRDAFNHMEGTLDWKYIQQLPYLTAVIKESLRLSSGIPGILPRVVPSQGAKFASYFIPGGTIVSVSTRAIHDNPRLFPEPGLFKPERWLGDEGKELEKWHVSFSKGPRRCIGSNLAYLEMYLCIAIFFVRFNMVLFETDASSMDWLDHGVASNKSSVKVQLTPATA